LLVVRIVHLESHGARAHVGQLFVEPLAILDRVNGDDREHRRRHVGFEQGGHRAAENHRRLGHAFIQRDGHVIARHRGRSERRIADGTGQRLAHRRRRVAERRMMLTLRREEGEIVQLQLAAEGIAVGKRRRHSRRGLPVRGLLVVCVIGFRVRQVARVSRTRG
jgi:hypothetical protein